MSQLSLALNAQYGDIDIAAEIFDRLQQAGKDLDRLTRDDLPAIDEFHAGGRDSTRELALIAGIRPGARVLDLGCGVGGPARTLAAEFGCTVVGVDISHEYCRAAQLLTGMLGMESAVSFMCADVMDLPLPDESFDVVWSQNVWMNIEDKMRFLQQVIRVLRPGGLFALESILAGPVPGIHLPVLWADTPALNHLVTAAAAKALLISSGLQERTWQDTTLRSIELQKKRQAINEQVGPPILSLEAIVPVNFRAKVANVLRNNLESRTMTIQAVYVA